MIKPLYILVLVSGILSGSGCTGSELEGEALQEAKVHMQERLQVLSDSTEAILKQRLGRSTPDYVRARENLWEAAQRFYEQRGYNLAWVEGNDLTRSAEAFIEGLCRAGDEGLDPAAYRSPRLQRAVEAVLDVRRPGPSARVELDLLLTNTFMQYSHDMINGRLDPAATKAEVYMQPKPVALDSVLALALQETSFKRLSEDLRPRYQQYTQLREALDRYRQIQADGGWPTLDEGASLEPGKPSPQVPRLRERLAASGDFDGYDPDDTSRVFDEGLAGALAAFQQRHGLEVDSLVGPSTLASLNVSVEERIGQIVLNLERWRWLPSELGTRHILVNIPDFTLTAFDDNAEVLTMPVVVGAEFEGRKTPVFSDVMEYIVFQPYWNVPPSIATDEILPKAYEDPTYLERNGYELVDSYAPDASVVEVEEETLDGVAEGKYRIRQLPGRSNALGHVKFMFPNEHNIYLHDTPADHLFSETERDYSHGCIRVERPDDLASYVLAKNEKKWSQGDIEEAMQGEREVIVLDQQIPVYIMYLSAFVDDGGTVHFRDDIYGYDADLAAELGKKEADVEGEQGENLCEII